MYCNNCGRELPQGAVFCPDCGEKQAPVRYCRYCGSQLDGDSVYCSACGHTVENTAEKKTQYTAGRATDPGADFAAGYAAGHRAGVEDGYSFSGSRYAPPPPPSLRPIHKWKAFFLCLFGGFLGLHRFYEGRMITGILYLCSFGLLGIGWMVDLIRILFKPNPYYVP